eukprot:TRINITY_DN1791_c0_g1_i2.p1 TRINITY_DN1791_c0_g1~~TRINITY_DN1791_c0_g1_i2.p1  ORF type:complete len:338 (+),score=81.11 TRINITY_DN1791_c0_g1_i2:28-1014(+)
MIRRPPRSTLDRSSAASDVYKRQYQRRVHGNFMWLLLIVLAVVAIAAVLYFNSKEHPAPDFTDKHVLITGGSSGIGENLAYLFANLGAYLTLASNQPEDLKRVKAACKDPSRVQILYLDTSNPREAAKVIRDHLTKNPVLDVLVLNAGISQRDVFERTSIDTAEKIMNINFMSYVSISKECIPYLKKSKGRISATSSLQGLFGNPARTLYAASKHALQGFFSSLRAELHQDGVSVTVVCPDYVRTNLSMNALKGDGSDFNKTDKQIQNGMDPIECVKTMVQAIYERVPEVWVCTLYYKCLVPLVRAFPSLHARYLLSRVKEQMSTIDK